MKSNEKSPSSTDDVIHFSLTMTLTSDRQVVCEIFESFPKITRDVSVWAVDRSH